MDRDLKALARRAVGLVDLTSLNDDDTPERIDAVCRQALTAAGPVAAVCIYPSFVAQARDQLGTGPVRVDTVVNFPHGTDDPDTVAQTAGNAIADGADEIDVVVPYHDLLAGRHQSTALLLTRCREACGAIPIKAILETGAFGDDTKGIAFAARTVIEAGANFVKTSTGKTAVGATLPAAETILRTIESLGAPVGFKAAGGIRTAEDAADYLELAARVMGDDWISPKTFRLGASSLLRNLLEVLGLGSDSAIGAGSNY